jgi:hypothetical protein
MAGARDFVVFGGAGGAASSGAGGAAQGGGGAAGTTSDYESALMQRVQGARRTYEEANREYVAMIFMNICGALRDHAMNRMLNAMVELIKTEQELHRWERAHPPPPQAVTVRRPALDGFLGQVFRFGTWLAGGELRE